MRPVRVLIVDDEPFARAVIRAYLGSYPQVSIVGEAADGEAALAGVSELDPDLVFLDVQMPGLDGLEVAARLRARPDPILIVFVTAFDQHALSAFELNAVDYLLKPFDEERFGATMDRVLDHERIKQTAELQEKFGRLIEDYGELKERFSGDALPPTGTRPIDRLVAKQSGRIVIIECSNIDWIAAAGDYVKVHVQGKEHLVSNTMRALELRLAPDMFMRIHRSSLVNIHKIKSLVAHTNGEYYILLEDGTRLKSSRTYSDNVRGLLSGEVKYRLR